MLLYYRLNSRLHAGKLLEFLRLAKTRGRVYFVRGKERENGSGMIASPSRRQQITGKLQLVLIGAFQHGRQPRHAERAFALLANAAV